MLNIDADEETQIRKAGSARGLRAFSKPSDGGCGLAAVLAADALSVPLSEIVSATRRSPESAMARQAAMYLAHVALGITLTAIGKFFDRDHSTVAHACRRVEDRRDDPAFDALIAELALSARIALCLDREISA